MTRTGNGNEFDAADDYMISRLIFGNKVAGLMLGNWRDRAITGNHDQWPGNLTILGGPTAARVTYFPLNAFPSEFPISLPGGRTIRFIKIDSDVDVHPFGAKRFFAHGSFVSQLNTLSMSVAPKADLEIRVLVLHHSPAHTDYVLGIDSASRDELSRVLLDKDICVLMTGHMHKPLLYSGPPDVKRPHMVLESRSGTTTQMDVVPAARLVALFGNAGGRRVCHNSLILHRIFERDGTIDWDAEPYVRKLQGGFCATGHVMSVRVWPRP